MTTQWIVLLGIVLAALALDGMLIRHWRQVKKARTPEAPPPAPLAAKIYVTPAQSPSPDQPAPRIVGLNPVGGTALPPAGLGRHVRAWPVPRPGWWPRLGMFTRTDILLITITVCLYLATRLYGLTAYPIFFHSDEAIHAVYAFDLLQNKGVYENDTFLPTYFPNGEKFNLSLSVYAQILPVWLFGKSVAVTRGFSALLTLIPAIVVALTVRNFLKLPYGWMATLCLGLAPAWFLHSRTAFETVMAVSMYAGFLYFYLRYRHGTPAHLYTALVFGALTFYAYSPAQMVIVASGLVLGVADFRYHVKHWKTAVGGLLLLGLLALPYIRFRLQVPEAVSEHLRDLGSYWLTPVPLSEKLGRFWYEYTYGLGPGYWFIHNLTDLERHQMGEYGHLLRVTLPFAVIGVGVALKHTFAKWLPFSQEPSDDLVRLTYRTLLIALLIAPLPGTLAQVGITRVLTYILPITILTAVGLITALRWLGRWLPVSLLAGGAFVLLTTGQLYLTRDALTNGPFWSRDYTLGGMQYGGELVFDEIQHYLDTYKAITVVLSPDWANGIDILARFFLPGPKWIEFQSANAFLYEVRPLPRTHLFVFTPAEYRDIVMSGKFKDVVIEKTILWPDGKPGFFFMRMQYVDNIEAIMAEEAAAHKVLEQGTIRFDDMTIPVRFSTLDMGTIEQGFDGRDDTLIRTAQVNPAIIELTLPETRTYRSLSVQVGAAKTQLTVKLYPTPDSEPIIITNTADARLDAPVIIMDFGQAIEAQIIRIEVLLLERPEREFVHIWEISLK